MKVLFLHQNFPAQFINVAIALVAAGHECVAVVPTTNNRPRIIRTIVYESPARAAHVNELGAQYLACVMRGTAVAEAIQNLMNEGYEPDIVIGHCGWGETLFVRDVVPECRLILHGEFFYSKEGGDTGFDGEFSSAPTLASAIKVRTRNAALLQALVDADLIIAPTAWQASRFPRDIQHKIRVIHEGIDTGVARPDPNAKVRLGRDNITLQPGDEVVTYVSRNLEPYRGYHSFMRALPSILDARKNARAVIVGGDGVSYGPSLNGQSWKQKFLSEVVARLDMDRVHFVNTIPHKSFIQLMQVSSAHVYLTYPFVLSWSVLEAMSCAAPVIGSRTSPVEEVIQHEENGLLVDFLDARAISRGVVDVLSEPNKFRKMRESARKTIEGRYDVRLCIPRWISAVQELAS